MLLLDQVLKETKAKKNSADEGKEGESKEGKSEAKGCEGDSYQDDIEASSLGICNLNQDDYPFITVDPTACYFFSFLYVTNWYGISSIYVIKLFCVHCFIWSS